MIAASLGVPLPALTCDPTTGTRSATPTLDTSTVLVMKARQKTMDEILKTVFKALGLKVKLRWPEINDEPVHRRVQAIDMSARLGVLRATEARAMVIDAWGDKWDDFIADPDPQRTPLGDQAQARGGPAPWRRRPGSCCGPGCGFFESRRGRGSAASSGPDEPG